MENKRSSEEYQVVRGNTIFKRTCLGSQRPKTKVEDQNPWITSLNDDLRRIAGTHLFDLKMHVEYYQNTQRASLHLAKISGLAAGQKISFDVENIPCLLLGLFSAYSKVGMNSTALENALNVGNTALVELKKLNEEEVMAE